MSHKFDASKFAKLDNPARMKELPPEDILLKAGLKDGDTFLDIGAGVGYFSFPASDIAGPDGRVVALDVSEIMTDELRRRVRDKKGGHGNIEVFLSTEYGLTVDDGSADFAMMCNVLHEVDDRPALMNSAYKSLKKRGILCVIEWIKSPMENGPPLHVRIDEAELGSYFHDSGFSNIRINKPEGSFYYATGVKP